MFEYKYSYMAKTGGCQWLFLLLLSCEMVISKARLESLEQSIYKRFPNAMNVQMRTKRKGGPAALPRGRHGFTRPPNRKKSPTYTSRCYQQIVPVFTAMQKDGKVTRSCDLYAVMNSEVAAVVMHTSYPCSKVFGELYGSDSLFEW